MNSRALVGKTIRRVVQEWHQYDEGHGRDRSLRAIEFTDGTVLRFVVLEGPGEYGISPIFPGRDLDGDDLNN